MSSLVNLSNVLQNMKKGTQMAKHEAPKEQKTLDEAAADPTPAAAADPAPAAQEGMAPGEVPIDEPAPPPAQEAKPENGAPAPAPAPRQALVPVGIGQFGVELKDLSELARFAKMVWESELAPKGFKNAQAIAAAIQLGAEIGLSPMTAIQNIAVINGRPGVYGDIPLALAQASGELEVFEEWFEHKGERVETYPQDADDSTTGVCHAKRRGKMEKTLSFSIAQAKKAGLWGKEGPWTNYPFRMLMWRPRQFVLRDLFPDKLKGVRTVDELRDGSIDTEVTHDSGPIPMPQRASEAAAPVEPTAAQA